METATATQADGRKAIVRHLIETVVNRDDPEAADAIIAPDFVVHPPGHVAAGASAPNGQRTGPEAFKAAARLLKAACPDFRIEAQDMIADGDRVAVRWEGHGTHTQAFMGGPPTGRAIVAYGTVIYRFDGERIAEMWPMVDRLGTLQQMGLA